nr:hypothetical protein [Sneathiella glossodoripedis]
MSGFLTNTTSGHGGATNLKKYETAADALDAIEKIYNENVEKVKKRFREFAEGDKTSPLDIAYYPYLV